MTPRQQYQRDYYRLRLAVTGKAPRQDAQPVREHLDALHAAGMHDRLIAEAAGIHRRTVEAILYSGQRTVRAATARAILAVRPPATTVGLVRRVRALATLGWTSQEIADAAELPVHVIKQYRRAAVTYLAPDRVEAITRAFDTLAMRTPPPAPMRGRTRALAARAGWAPPLAWDDIDTDPAPNLGTDTDAHIDHIAVRRAIDGTPTRLSRAERLEVIRALAPLGMSDAAIARRCMCVPDTILRDRQAHGIESRWAA